jgi:hypothetical protein
VCLHYRRQNFRSLCTLCNKGIFFHQSHSFINQVVLSGVIAIAAPTPLSSTIVLPVCSTPPSFSPKSSSLPPSTWKTLSLSSSPSTLLFRFATCKLFAAKSRTLPTLYSVE